MRRRCNPSRWPGNLHGGWTRALHSAPAPAGARAASRYDDDQGRRRMPAASYRKSAEVRSFMMCFGTDVTVNRLTNALSLGIYRRDGIARCGRRVTSMRDARSSAQRTAFRQRRCDSYRPLPDAEFRKSAMLQGCPCRVRRTAFGVSWRTSSGRDVSFAEAR